MTARKPQTAEDAKAQETERQVNAAKRLMRLKTARERLIDYTAMSMPDPSDPDDPEASRYQIKPHHELICNELEAVERGETTRLIVNIGPRHGKSEIISKRFPTWFMGRDPYRQTIVSSYADDLATEFGREARDIMNQSFYQQVFPGVELRKGSQAADRLQTTRGGLMVYRGVGSALTGYGADLAIVDDPIKDRASANSRTIRDTQWHWFTQVLMTRLMGAMGRVVIVMTRWHDDDVIGRLTDPENPHYDPIEASKWRILNLPAIAETDDILGREEGEILWPERIPREFLEGQRRLDPAGFNALYQGRPAPPEGNFFKKEHLRTYKAHDLPRDLRYYAASDHAVSMQQDRDRTVAGCVGVDADDNIYIMPDVVWRQMDAETATEVMMDQMRRYHPLFWWAEKGHISQSIGPFLRKRMLEENTYINIDEKTPVKDKQTRAQAIQARIAMGKVYLPDFAPWYAAAVDELLNFPFGNHDDFVDWLAWIGIGLSQQTPARRSMSKEKEVPETGSARWITESSKWHSQLRDSASRYFN